MIQFTLRAFYTVRTWPWMMLFYKIRPLLKSAQVEKELVAVRKEFNALKETFDRSVSLSINPVPVVSEWSWGEHICPTINLKNLRHNMNITSVLNSKKNNNNVAVVVVVVVVISYVVFRSEVKRREAEEKQVVLVQEKIDLGLQLQAVS